MNNDLNPISACDASREQLLRLGFTLEGQGGGMRNHRLHLHNPLAPFQVFACDADDGCEIVDDGFGPVSLGIIHDSTDPSLYLTFPNGHALASALATIPTDVNRTALALALAFLDRLATDLTRDQFASVVTLNASEPNPSVCHSHDVIDANESMAAAFAFLFGRPITLPGDAAAQGIAYPEWESALWSEAWSLAKALMPHLDLRTD